MGRFERKILRRIYGATKIGENEYRRRWNSEIYQLYDDIDIIFFIRVSRLRWLGHVYRMEDDNPCRRILEEKIYNKRPRGRPRHRWWNAVLEDIERLRVRDWKAKSRDRDEWRGIISEARVLLRTVEP